MVTVDNLTNSYVGLSTDEKPTENVRNGSTFVEMDTQTMYAWNAETGEWVEQSGSGDSGGGSGGSGGILVVNAIREREEDPYFVIDKSFSDIYGAIGSGKTAVLRIPFYSDTIEAALTMYNEYYIQFSITSYFAPNTGGMLTAGVDSYEPNKAFIEAYSFTVTSMPL